LYKNINHEMRKENLKMKIRRVVTGHDVTGKAMIKTDDIIEGQVIGDDAAFALLWTTDTAPADNMDEMDGSKREVGLAAPGGSVCRMVDIFPGECSPMHRTQSLDYGIVLEGEIELELDEGEVAKLKAGDVIVQRGTIHAWNNKTDKPCRIAFILLDAKQIKIGEEALEEINS
jgi:quercetin dioxygenase-like cupin family protein